MNLRQLKNNICLVVAVKLHQFIYDHRVIEIAKSFRGKFSFGFYTGGFAEAVISAKIIFVKEQVHLFTAITAESFIISMYRIIAGFAAMVTGCLYGCMLCYFYGFIVEVSKLYDAKK